MTKVLITGGAGYVGAHCAKLLYAAGFSPVVLDNLTTGCRDFLRWGKFIEGDIRDAKALDHLFATEDVAAVLHFAALSAVGESMKFPGRYYDINVHGSRVLLDAMTRAGVRALVFSSSCATYGAPRELPITEETPKEPINPYGMSKVICERMMDDFDTAHGIKSVRLRYFNAAGADPASGLGEDHARETRLIPLALDALTGRKPPLTLFGTDYGTPDGTAVRDYIHVADLADGHLRALRHLLRGGGTFAVNLGTGEGASVRQVLDTIKAVSGREVPLRLAPRRAGDPAVLVADTSKARALLDWVPQHSSLKAIVSDAWQWHRQRFA